MTILAKQKLVSEVSEEVGDFLTVTNTRRVADVLTDKLNDYEINELKPDDIGNETIGLLKAFLNAKEIEGRSRKTIERYSFILEKALRGIGSPAEQVNVFQIRAYLMEEKNRGLQDSSIEGVRCVLSSFFGWLWKEGLIKTNPCANVGAVKCQKKIRLPYSAVEIAKLKASCSSQRDLSIVCFLLSTGARISEVCALNRDDIDFRALECTVMGKGNKERTVYIDEVTAMELNNYLDSRCDDKPALFIGKGTDRITPGGIRFMLHELGKQAGVENVHPHRFRRTLATSLINHGMSIQEVATLLGHENINTTMKYVYINSANVKSSYRKYA